MSLRLKPAVPHARFTMRDHSPRAFDRWQSANPVLARTLIDARLQLHYGAQFCTALGISYLPAKADDSHTNLGWRSDRGALASRLAPGARGVSIALQVSDLTLVILEDAAVGATIPLDGLAIAAATDRLRGALGAAGLEPRRFTLERHYDLPPHAVASGAAFSAGGTEAFRELAKWIGNAALELGRVAATVTGASEVRLWPHHLDIAMLIALPHGASSGVGLELGDRYYDEPYFYVNAHPVREPARLTAPLGGGGSWHTHEWIGAVLPVSRVSRDAAAQQAQVRAFLASAIEACRALTAK